MFQNLFNGQVMYKSNSTYAEMHYPKEKKRSLHYLANRFPNSSNKKTASGKPKSRLLRSMKPTAYTLLIQRAASLQGAATCYSS